MPHNHRSQTPIASACEYLIPCASLALSLPTLAVDLVIINHAHTGYTFDVNAAVVQISPLAFGCLYIVFGPIFGSRLCVTQRTYAKQTYGSVHLLRFSIKRLNTIALYVAMLALGLLIFAALLTIFRSVLTAGGPD